MEKLDLSKLQKRYLPPSKRPAVETTKKFTDFTPRVAASPNTPTADQLLNPPLPAGAGTYADSSPYLTVEDLPGDWLEVMMNEAKIGRTTVSYMRALGLTKAGLETLLATSPAFREGYERALLYAAEWWEDRGRGMTCGEKGNATVWVTNMVNKWGWNSEKRDSTATLSSSVTVSKELSEEEALAELKRRGIPVRVLDGELDGGVADET